LLSRKRVEVSEPAFQGFPAGTGEWANFNWLGGSVWSLDARTPITLTGAGTEDVATYPVPFSHRWVRLEMLHTDSSDVASEDSVTVKVFFQVNGRDTVWYRRDSIIYRDGSVLLAPGRLMPATIYKVKAEGTANNKVFSTFEVEVLQT